MILYRASYNNAGEAQAGRRTLFDSVRLPAIPKEKYMQQKAPHLIKIDSLPIRMLTRFQARIMTAQIKKSGNKWDLVSRVFVLSLQFTRMLRSSVLGYER